MEEATQYMLDVLHYRYGEDFEVVRSRKVSHDPLPYFGRHYAMTARVVGTTDKNSEFNASWEVKKGKVVLDNYASLALHPELYVKSQQLVETMYQEYALSIDVHAWTGFEYVRGDGRYTADHPGVYVLVGVLCDGMSSQEQFEQYVQPLEEGLPELGTQFAHVSLRCFDEEDYATVKQLVAEDADTRDWPITTMATWFRWEGE